MGVRRLRQRPTAGIRCYIGLLFSPAMASHRSAPVDFKAFGGNTGIVPISREGVQDRVFKLTLQYRFL